MRTSSHARDRAVVHSSDFCICVQTSTRYRSFRCLLAFFGEIRLQPRNIVTFFIYAIDYVAH
jgi:hypothetical protein